MLTFVSIQTLFTGKSFAVRYGAGNLPKGLAGLGNQRELHQSVLVRKGTSFRGYDKAGNVTDPRSKTKPPAKKSNFKLVEDLGEKVIVNAPATKHQPLNFKSLNAKISFVSCTKKLDTGKIWNLCKDSVME